jgi:hypothetical protein
MRSRFQLEVQNTSYQQPYQFLPPSTVAAGKPYCPTLMAGVYVTALQSSGLRSTVSQTEHASRNVPFRTTATRAGDTWRTSVLVHRFHFTQRPIATEQQDFCASNIHPLWPESEKSLGLSGACVPFVHVLLHATELHTRMVR